MLTGLGAANQFAPLDHADLGLNADLRVRLQQLRAEARVGVQQAAGRARPDGGLEAVLEPGLPAGLGFGEVMWITRQVFGVAPGVGRVRAVGGFGGASNTALR
jgi:hypothetical protein